MDYAKLNGAQVQPNTCGRLALENRELSFWQSRQTRAGGGAAPLPQLTDIRALARDVRQAFATGASK